LKPFLACRFLSDREFRRWVERYQGDARLRGFSCWDQYLAMASLKSNVLLQRCYSRAVDKSTGVRLDQTVFLSSFESASVYPDALRRVSYFDAEGLCAGGNRSQADGIRSQLVPDSTDSQHHAF